MLTGMNISDPALRTGSAGQETVAQIRADIPHEGYDLVIMNPPFTSDTKHRDAEDGIVNAAFAAYGASDKDQEDMANRLKRLAKDGSYHGHAGLGSAFVELAHKKVRPNGVVAFVLPFTTINGPSWAKFRELISNHYTDITIASIAADGHDMSFSSDTGIAECLVIARRIVEQREPSRRGTFVSLRHRPKSFADAQEFSKVIRDSGKARRLEDGPYGGTAIYSGDALAGYLVDAPIDDHENGWSVARIADLSVAQVAHSLSNGKLWLPAEAQARRLSIAQIEQIGQRGLDSQLLISAAHKGPFIKAPASPTATYPSLWNHDAKNETSIVCLPDSELIVKQGMEDRVAKVWATASRAHINRDFRFTSQPLTAAMTEHKSLGGVAWPNVKFSDSRFDYPFVLWHNSTLGLLLFWWHANRQQSGRGRKTIRSSGTLPMLDLSTLTDEQMVTAEAIFNEMRDKELKPAYLADADPNRALLDKAHHL